MADKYKLAGDASRAPFSLFGEVRKRVARVLQAATGTDPEQMGIGGFTLDSQLHPHIKLLDATQAPFRRNGKAWAQYVNVAAGGAGVFGTVVYVNQVPAQPDSSTAAQVNAVIIDEIEYGEQIGAGAGSGAQYGLCYPPGDATLLYRSRWTEDFLSPPNSSLAKAAADVGLVALKRSVPCIGSDATLAPTVGMSDNIQVDVIGRIPGADNIAGTAIVRPYRRQLSGVVLWPGMAFVVQGFASNVAFYVNLKGRVVNFGEGVVGL